MAMDKQIMVLTLTVLTLGLTFVGHAQEVAEPLVTDQDLYIAIHLKDGSALKVEGRIIDSDEHMITVERRSGGRVVIPRENIRCSVKSQFAL